MGSYTQQEKPVATTNFNANIPTVWKIKETQVIESMVDEAGQTWILLKWSPKLHLFLMLPEHREVAELIEQIKTVGYVNTAKWYKHYPLGQDLDF
tara:strand:+ start:204 stop:488 length:285 start_codon:yes stop_codon:yes gene_type:complete